MKRGLRVLLLPLLLFVLASCADDASRLEEKWQLKQIQYADGTVEEVGRVFYNFQKGSFSAICLQEDESYFTLFGTYSLSDDKISIILLNDYSKEIVEECLRWSGSKQMFRIEELTSSALRLKNEEIDLVFKKY